MLRSSTYLKFFTSGLCLEHPQSVFFCYGLTTNVRVSFTHHWPVASSVDDGGGGGGGSIELLDNRKESEMAC